MFAHWHVVLLHSGYTSSSAPRDPAAPHARRPSAAEVLAHPLFWTLGEKVRYIDHIKRGFGSVVGLQAIADDSAKGDGGFSGGDWRRHERLPGALWPRASPGRFVRGDGSTSHYGKQTSELVRLIRNLSQHFAEQHADLREAIIVGADGRGGEAGALSAAEQEAAVGHCFFAAFPSLVVRLRRAEEQAEAALR